MRQYTAGIKHPSYERVRVIEQVIHALAKELLAVKLVSKNEFVKALKQIHAGNKYFSGAVSNVLANRLLNTKPYIKNVVRCHTDGFVCSKEPINIITGNNLGDLVYEGYNENYQIKGNSYDKNFNL